MMNYAVWLKEEKKSPYFRLISAEGLTMAKMIAKDLAQRCKLELVGVSPFDGETEIDKARKE